MLNAALIGVSGFGAVHCNDLLRQVERGSLRIVGAAVRDPAKDAEMCARLKAVGCEIFSHYDEMFSRLEGSIDLCTIPTSIHTHAEMTVAALAAGSNVLVEKPAAATLREVDRMRGAEQATDRFVAVGFQTMYAPETMMMKRAILEGEIGSVRAIKCRGLWPRLDRYYHQSSWIGRIRIGDHWVLDSPFNNAMAHQVNMICFLAGSSLHKSATLESIEAELYRAHDIETADTVALRMVTETGIPLYFFGTHSSEASVDPEIVVRGDRGQIHWTFSRVSVTRFDNTTEETACQTGLTLRDTMLDAIIGKTKDPDQFICGLDIAETHTLTVGGAHLSSNIYSIPDHLINRIETDGSIKTTVTGLDDIIGRAFSEEKLFNELGVYWANAGKLISLKEPETVAAAFI